MARHGQFFGRLCSYPQGHLPIVPQILSLAALYAVYYALPWTPWFDSNLDFMCIEYSIGSTYGTGSGSTYHECLSLHLTDPAYWNDEDDKMKYWPIQLATVFAVLAATAGSIAFLVLLSATCFPLEPKNLALIAWTYFACGILSLFTFVALAFDICEGRDYCKRERTHLENAGVTMVFGIIFFFWAFAATRLYANMVKNGQLPRDADEDEKTHIGSHDEEDRLLANHYQDTDGKNTNPSLPQQPQQQPKVQIDDLAV